jgi:hypothetical protein
MPNPGGPGPLAAQAIFSLTFAKTASLCDANVANDGTKFDFLALHADPLRELGQGRPDEHHPDPQKWNSISSTSKPGPPGILPADPFQDPALEFALSTCGEAVRS